MMRKWNRIAVFGWGHVGSTVSDLLNDAGFEVSVFDKEKDGTDLTDPAQIESALVHQDAVISCLPFSLNKQVAQTVKDIGVHYFDLTEDVKTTNTIRKLADGAETVFMPQCGLAPGFIGILGMEVFRRSDFTLEGLELRVGALPAYPSAPLGYACTWSPEGVINEYIKPCTVISGGIIRTTQPLHDVEYLELGGHTLQAFNTSGGLGTLCETLLGKIQYLNYKTLRYPRHLDAMRTLLHDFGLQFKPDLAAYILRTACPATQDDLVFVSAKGYPNYFPFQAVYKPRMLAGKMRTAIAWTTAAGACAVVELVANGILPGSGFIRQEDVLLSDFFATRSGGLLKCSG